MPVVKSHSEVNKVRNRFEVIVYEYIGEFDIPKRRYLRKDEDENAHQLHIFEAGDNANINRHLTFKDYVRAHENIKNTYV